MRGVRPAVLVMLSFAVEAASAGPLVAASYSQIVAGARFDAAALAPSGTLVGNTFTLDPGSAFATTGCVAGIGNPENFFALLRAQVRSKTSRVSRCR